MSPTLLTALPWTTTSFLQASFTLKNEGPASHLCLRPAQHHTCLLPGQSPTAVWLTQRPSIPLLSSFSVRLSPSPRIMSHFPSTKHTLRTPFIFREKKPPRPFPLDPLILTTRRASFTPQSSFFLHFPQKEADSHIKSLSSVHCCRPHKSLPCLCVAGKRHVPFHSPRRLVIMAFLTQEHLTMPKEEWFQTSA